jgi:hypothetical protein
MTYHRKTENSLSLLGGAVLGAVAMYLMDPEMGRRRREHLGEVAGDALHGAGETVGPLWERVSDTTRRLGRTVADKTGEYSSALAAGAAGATEGAREAGSRWTGRAGEYTADARHGLSDWLHRTRRSAGHAISGERESSHAGAYAATGLGTLALGAGVMYLLDPERGRGRRAMVMNKVTGVFSQTGTAFSRLGRDLVNRAYGVAAETRGVVKDRLGYGDELSAEKLLQRVRSEMGRSTSHPSAVQVMTDNNGRVTLTGCVLAGEADGLVSTVRGVRGVTEVVNLLTIEDSAEAVTRSTAQGTGSSVTPM